MSSEDWVDLLLDPGDDLHFAATVGTTNWVDLVNLFEQPGESYDGARGRGVRLRSPLPWGDHRGLGGVPFEPPFSCVCPAPRWYSGHSNAAGVHGDRERGSSAVQSSPADP